MGASKQVPFPFLLQYILCSVSIAIKVPNAGYGVAKCPVIKQIRYKKGISGYEIMGISFFHYTLIISNFSIVNMCIFLQAIRNTCHFLKNNFHSKFYGFQRCLILNLVVIRVYGKSYPVRNNCWLTSRMRLR